jgi:multidrug efflux pump
MNLSALFIARPVATALVTAGIALAGIASLFLLPVSALPSVEFPVIAVSASMPGADPETMATTVASTLERHLGRIAGVNEITSSSNVGTTRVVLQFDLNRNIDDAAREVQGAISAARVDLPASLKSNPTWRKANPANQPVAILALTSAAMTRGALYDLAATVVAPKLSQIDGVGQVDVRGSSLPAVRVELNALALFHYGIGLEDVRAALAAANANSPKGGIDVGERRLQLYSNDQALKADDFRDLIIAWRNQAAVRLKDVASVTDDVEDRRNQALVNGQPAITLNVLLAPGANIIDTVDRVKEVLPEIARALPASADLQLAMERTGTIRAALSEVGRGLVISVLLVVLVVWAFLRDWRATLVPAVAVPVSLLGTLAVMYLCGYGLDTLSLMALTIATGFVVDDAVVVLENARRHVEQGETALKAALMSARETSATVVSMSLSLVVVFAPILLMGGIVGRLFREFAVAIAVAILVSLFVSLTATPAMCARLVGHYRGRRRQADAVPMGWLGRAYDAALGSALGHRKLIIAILLATIALGPALYRVAPKGFFPEQDTGLFFGGLAADQSSSFASMTGKLNEFSRVLLDDPAVKTVVVSLNSGQSSFIQATIALKPLAERRDSSRVVADRLRPKLNAISGTRAFIAPVQDIRFGGRGGNANQQFTLRSEDLDALREWGPKLTEALRSAPELTDVSADQAENGLQVGIDLDRSALARYGLSVSQINNTLYDAFGQRQASRIYNDLNQYSVVMALQPDQAASPAMLDRLKIATSGGVVSGTAASAGGGGGDSAAANAEVNKIANSGRGGASTGSAVSTKTAAMIPFSAVARTKDGKTPTSVNHQSGFVAATISFNTATGYTLDQALDAIRRTMVEIGVPTSIHGTTEGTSKLFQSAMGDQPLLIAGAILAIYIVLGILYESWIHPLTILSTIPSAGVGAIVALVVSGTEMGIIGLVGILLLIGIVKKNAILMIDFALAAERERGLSPEAAIRDACLKRLRPILMTTFAALAGAVPLALGLGQGAELRQPLGIAIIGGLMISQALTLFTTPVVYLTFDKLRRREGRGRSPSVVEV